MNRSNYTQRKMLNPKLIYSLAGILVLTAIVKLFSFSSFETQPDDNYQDFFNRHYKIFALNIPDKLDFAGERVPLEDFEVKERFDKELHINTYWQSQTLLFIKRANRWFPVIEPILKRNGIPDDFKYLPLIESGFMNVVSPAGATGFWQFMKPAANIYGLEVSSQVDERYHLEKSTEAACKYLKDAHRQFGNWTMAAAAFNMGMGGAKKQMARQKADNYYDLLLIEETSRYVFRLLAVKEILSNPKKYGFHIRKKDLYPVIETYTVEIDSSVSHFADFAAHFHINYKTLKVFNPWLRDNFLTNKTGKVYQIKIPKEEYKQRLVNEQSTFADSLLVTPPLNKDTVNALRSDSTGAEGTSPDE